MYSFSNFEPVHCSMSNSKSCFLSCMQVSHLFKNFPIYCDPHSQRLYHSQWSRSRWFLWNSLLFLWSNRWSLFPLPFLNLVCISGCSQFTYCWSLASRILSIILLECATVWWFEHFWHCSSLQLEWKLTFFSPVATAEFSKFAGIMNAVL